MCLNLIATHASDRRMNSFRSPHYMRYSETVVDDIVDGVRN